MPIITNQNNFFCENHFIFIENSLLLKRTVHNTPLQNADLPGEDTLRLCMENQIASDWFAEPELNYSAMMLEKDTPLPAGCEEISLRDFFWRTKTKEEQEAAQTSALGSLASRAHGFLRLRETYRYCPACGTLLQVHTTLAAKVCPNCGREDFPRLEPAVIVLVSKGDEVLLVKSKTVSNAASKKYYSCIAGFVEHGETIEQSAIREVKEETGICIKNVRYRGSQPWPYPDQIMLAFTADYESGDIVKQEEEIEDARWFPKSSLPNIPPAGSVAYNLIMGKF